MDIAIGSGAVPPDSAAAPRVRHYTVNAERTLPRLSATSKQKEKGKISRASFNQCEIGDNVINRCAALAVSRLKT